MPADWSAAERAQKDTEARWTKKHGKNYYGYKRHANTGRRWGFIRRLEVSPASVNDMEAFEAIPGETNTGKDVYADRGYAKHERKTALYVQGYRARTQRKGTAGHPIREAQQRHNRRIAKQRTFGERPFARLARRSGKYVRTVGLARTRAVIELKVIARNPLHLARLKHWGVVPA